MTSKTQVKRDIGEVLLASVVFFLLGFFYAEMRVDHQGATQRINHQEQQLFVSPIVHWPGNP